MTLKLLAIDTTTDTLSLAVAVGAQTWTHTGPGSAQASTTLIPAALGLLREAGLALVELDAIVFGQGPGAFTGLRTSCAVAQGLGLGIRARGNERLVLLPVNSLLAVADEARHTAAAALPPTQPGTRCERVLALLDARMGEVYVAEVDFSARDWHTPATYLTKPELVHAPQHWDGQPWMAAGNAFTPHADHLRLPDGVPTVAALPTASALLRLAPSLLALGLGVDPEHAAPLYVRDKVAQTTAERMAERMAERHAATAR